MNDEPAKLRRDLERYRLLLDFKTDPLTGKVLRELMAQTKARLREIANKSRLSQQRG